MIPKHRIKNYEDLLKAKWELKLYCRERELQFLSDIRLIKAGCLGISALRNGSSHWKRLAAIFGKQVTDKLLAQYLPSIIQKVQKYFH